MQAMPLTIFAFVGESTTLLLYRRINPKKIIESFSTNPTEKKNQSMSKRSESSTKSSFDTRPSATKKLKTTEKQQYGKLFSKQTQYSKDVISLFENTFGKHHMSAGGTEMTQNIAEVLGPTLLKKKQPRCQMLDVGFGVGGSAMEFSEKYGAEVYGIDINPVGYEMACTELERRNRIRLADGKEELKVHFDLVDATHGDFEEESFDVIYSRDTLLHLDGESKKGLFHKFKKWLKPGGMVVIADYSLGRNSYATGLPTPSFTSYLEARGYHMWTPQTYANCLSDAGFDDAKGEDLGVWYCVTCQKEIDRILLPPKKLGGSQEQQQKCWLLPEDKRASLEKTYRDKIQMTLRGDRSYTMVSARKSAPFKHLRQQVVDAYTKLSSDGYVLSCDGNVSIRVVDVDVENRDDDGQKSNRMGGKFLVTPSGVDIPDLDESKVVLCDRNGKSVAGTSCDYKPSSETGLHTLIYEARPDVNAIVHSHSVYACALACCRLPLPVSHYAVCELTSHDDMTTSRRKSCHSKPSFVQCTPYHTYGTWPLAVSTVTCLGDNYAVLLANHGAVVVGKDLEEAMYLTSRLERECEIYYRSLQIGKPIPLTGKEVQELRLRDRTYGQQEDVEDEENGKASSSGFVTTFPTSLESEKIHLTQQFRFFSGFAASFL